MEGEVFITPGYYLQAVKILMMIYIISWWHVGSWNPETADADSLHVEVDRNFWGSWEQTSAHHIAAATQSA